MLEPAATSLLPFQIRKQFLPSMHKQPQIPLINLIPPPPRLQKIRQRPYLRRQNRNLHLTTPSIWPHAGSLRQLILWSRYYGGWFWRQRGVGVVTSEVGDAAGFVYAEAVFAAAEGEGGDAVEGFVCDVCFGL